MISFTRNVQNRSIYRDRKQPGGCRGLGEEERGVPAPGARVSSGVMKMLWNWTEVLVEYYCEPNATEPNASKWCILRYVNFTSSFKKPYVHRK